MIPAAVPTGTPDSKAAMLRPGSNSMRSRSSSSGWYVPPKAATVVRTNDSYSSDAMGRTSMSIGLRSSG